MQQNRAEQDVTGQYRIEEENKKTRIKSKRSRKKLVKSTFMYGGNTSQSSISQVNIKSSTSV